MGKGLLRSDSETRMGNAGPGGRTTSKPSWGACVRVCKETAVEESSGPRNPWVHDGSRLGKRLLDVHWVQLEIEEAIPMPAKPESFSVL